MIQLPDRPVGWEATFVGGLIFSSQHWTWADFSDVQSIDGVSLPFSREPIEKLLLWVPNTNGDRFLFLPQEPTSMFALTRYAVGPGGASLWRYSLFGFYEGNYRKMLRITSYGIEHLLEDRATPLHL